MLMVCVFVCVCVCLLYYAHIVYSCVSVCVYVCVCVCIVCTYVHLHCMCVHVCVCLPLCVKRCWVGDFCAYMYTGPFKNYPQITVYHPNEDNKSGHAFANIGWTGWIGSITGELYACWM